MTSREALKSPNYHQFQSRTDARQAPFGIANFFMPLNSFAVGHVQIRVMPNTPCLIGQAASAYVLGNNATGEDAEKVFALISSCGEPLLSSLLSSRLMHWSFPEPTDSAMDTIMREQHCSGIACLRRVCCQDVAQCCDETKQHECSYGTEKLPAYLCGVCCAATSCEFRADCDSKDAQQGIE